MANQDTIVIQGLRQNNLKNVSVDMTDLKIIFTNGDAIEANDISAEDIALDDVAVDDIALDENIIEEPIVEEEVPPMPDLSDPNKKLSPEEIEALIASL